MPPTDAERGVPQMEGRPSHTWPEVFTRVRAGFGLLIMAHLWDAICGTGCISGEVYIQE